MTRTINDFCGNLQRINRAEIMEKSLFPSYRFTVE